MSVVILAWFFFPLAPVSVSPLLVTVNQVSSNKLSIGVLDALKQLTLKILLH